MRAMSQSRSRKNAYTKYHPDLCNNVTIKFYNICIVFCLCKFATFTDDIVDIPGFFPHTLCTSAKLLASQFQPLSNLFSVLDLVQLLSTPPFLS